jgi:hypothetical protein
VNSTPHGKLAWSPGREDRTTPAHMLHPNSPHWNTRSLDNAPVCGRLRMNTSPHGGWPTQAVLWLEWGCSAAVPIIEMKPPTRPQRMRKGWAPSPSVSSKEARFSQLRGQTGHPGPTEALSESPVFEARDRLGGWTCGYHNDSDVAHHQVLLILHSSMEVG